jgi:ATP-dependent DNA helicase Q4
MFVLVVEKVSLYRDYQKLKKQEQQEVQVVKKVEKRQRAKKSSGHSKRLKRQRKDANVVNDAFALSDYYPLMAARQRSLIDAQLSPCSAERKRVASWLGDVEYGAKSPPSSSNASRSPSQFKPFALSTLHRQQEQEQEAHRSVESDGDETPEPQFANDAHLSLKSPEAGASPVMSPMPAGYFGLSRATSASVDRLATRLFGSDDDDDDDDDDGESGATFAKKPNDDDDVGSSNRGRRLAPRQQRQERMLQDSKKRRRAAKAKPNFVKLKLKGAYAGRSARRGPSAKALDKEIDERQENPFVGDDYDVDYFSDEEEHDEEEEKDDEERRRNENVAKLGEIDLLAYLKEHFGFDSFRAGQQRIVERVLRGKPTLGVLATGVGKSLCYQMAAKMLREAGLGYTLVVCPLVSLMQDQVANLAACVRGVALHGRQTAAQVERALARIEAGQLDLVFVAPERLASASFVSSLVGGRMPPIALCAVDEAHTVSEWAHNFRVSYLQLGSLLSERLRPRCTLALTATATPRTQRSVLRALNIEPRPSRIVSVPTVRANLTLAVTRCRESDRHRQLLDLLSHEPYASYSSIVVYVTYRREADALASYLHEHGVDACSYHAGLDGSERRRLQARFIGDKVRVMVATVAFGMGINKADIRAVVHFALPRSVENYVQEIGRAGRDGAPASCHLLLDESHYTRLQSFAHSDGVDVGQVSALFELLFRRPSYWQKGATATSMPYNVALPVQRLEQRLDMSAAAISTLLAYVEIRSRADASSDDDSDSDGNDALARKPMIELLADTYRLCRVKFFKRSAAVLAKRNRLVDAMVQGVGTRHASGSYDVTLHAIAHALGSRADGVLAELRRLKTAGELDFEQFDKSFHVRVWRVPKRGRERAALVESFAKQARDLELCRAAKVRAIFDIASQPFDADTGMSEQLHRSLADYFFADDTASDDLSRIAMPLSAGDGALVRSDIRVLLARHSDAVSSPRAIARIFHAIPSPSFPASTWARSSFWGQLAHIPFLQLVAIVEDQQQQLADKEKQASKDASDDDDDDDA